MKRAILIAMLLSPIGICAADPLVAIDQARIAEIATEHLLKVKPEIQPNDLEARLISVVTHPKSEATHKADVTVDFIIKSSEQLLCEPPSPQFLALLDEKQRKEIPDKLCTKNYRGFSVSFNSLEPSGPFRVRASGMGVHP